MTTAAKLTPETITLGIAKEFTTTRLTKYENRTYCEIAINVAKIGGERAISGFAWGFAATLAIEGVCFLAKAALSKEKMAVDAGAKAIKVIAQKCAEKVVEKTAKEIGKEILIKGLVVGGIGAAVGLTHGVYEAGTYEYKFYINPLEFEDLRNGVKREETEKAQKIVEAFLEDPSFISEAVAEDLMDPISSGAMIYPLKTPCNHYFDAPHIIRWIEEQKKDTCPTCRAKLKTEDLQFSWEMGLKITKIIRTIIGVVNQNSRNSLPESLRHRDVSELKGILEPFNQYTEKQIAIIDLHVKEALRLARENGKIDENYCLDSNIKLHEWKKIRVE